MVIKNITGRTVSSQIRERILTPLSLNHTYLEVEESYVDPVAHPWDSGIDFASHTCHSPLQHALDCRRGDVDCGEHGAMGHGAL